MADEMTPSENTTAEEPDYKALYEQAVSESRKWESRAKANKDKADRLDALTPQGGASVEERLAALEQENTAMKEQAARNELVAKVATATGLASSIVASLSGSDEKTLTAQAQAIADLKPKGAPSAPEAGKFPRDGAESKDAAMRKFAHELFSGQR